MDFYGLRLRNKVLLLLTLAIASLSAIPAVSLAADSTPQYSDGTRTYEEGGPCPNNASGTMRYVGTPPSNTIDDWRCDVIDVPGPTNTVRYEDVQDGAQAHSHDTLGTGSTGSGSSSSSQGTGGSHATGNTSSSSSSGDSTSATEQTAEEACREYARSHSGESSDVSAAQDVVDNWSSLLTFAQDIKAGNSDGEGFQTAVMNATILVNVTNKGININTVPGYEDVASTDSSVDIDYAQQILSLQNAAKVLQGKKVGKGSGATKESALGYLDGQIAGYQEGLKAANEALYQARKHSYNQLYSECMERANQQEDMRDSMETSSGSTGSESTTREDPSTTPERQER